MKGSLWLWSTRHHPAIESDSPWQILSPLYIKYLLYIAIFVLHSVVNLVLLSLFLCLPAWTLKLYRHNLVRVTQMPSVSSFTVLKNFWWFQAIIWVLSSSFDFILLGEREIRRQVFCPELISSKQIRVAVKKYGRHVLFTSTWTTFDCLLKERSQTKYTVQV